VHPDTVLAHGAQKGIDTLNVVEVVDVSAPDTGMWAVLIKPVILNADQDTEVSGTNQDFSLVFDLTASRVTNIQRDSGLTFKRLGAKKVRPSTIGDVFIDSVTSGTSGTGLCFKRLGTTKAAFCDDGRLYHAGAFSANNPVSLAGSIDGLAFRKGAIANLAVFSNGNVSARRNKNERAF